MNVVQLVESGGGQLSDLDCCEAHAIFVVRRLQKFLQEVYFQHSCKDMSYFNWNIALFVDESRLSIKDIAICEERVFSMDLGKDDFVSADQVKGYFQGST